MQQVLVALDESAQIVCNLFIPHTVWIETVLALKHLRVTVPVELQLIKLFTDACFITIWQRHPSFGKRKVLIASCNLSRR